MIKVFRKRANLREDGEANGESLDTLRSKRRTNVSRGGKGSSALARENTDGRRKEIRETHHRVKRDRGNSHYGLKFPCAGGIEREINETRCSWGDMDTRGRPGTPDGMAGGNKIQKRYVLPGRIAMQSGIGRKFRI